MSWSRKKDFSGLSDKEIAESAFNKVVRTVSISEQSTIKMRDKLTAAGYPAAVVDSIMEKAVDLGFIDDTRYSECLIRSTLAMGKGLSFAEKEIEALGVDILSLDAYNEYLELGEDDLVEQALEYLGRHVPKSKNLRDGCYRKLVTRGYSSTIASKAARIFSERASRG